MKNLFSRDNKTLNTAPPSAIPLIDFDAFTSRANTATSQEKQAIAQDLVYAFRTAGFVYLRNHGVPDSDVARMFKASAAFFALRQAEKVFAIISKLSMLLSQCLAIVNLMAFLNQQQDKISWESPESNRGYAAVGREKLTELDKEGRVEDIKTLNKINPDLKESLDIGKNVPDTKYKNKFHSAEFEEQCESFFQMMQLVNLRVMSAVAQGLDLKKKEFFTQFIDKSNNTLRLLHYPQVSVEKFSDKSRRCGAHCDYGSWTFLFQDNVGGLEVQERSTNKYVRATPIPNTVLVNVGDLLQRWTNDYLISTEHRVVQPYEVDEAGYLPARYSIVYFCNPNSDVEIEPLEQFIEDNCKKYSPVNAGKYLIGRLSSTYV
ncbi:hypothetical protein HK100_012025 [Physocladia obscura]|uniref:Fe2OG dioxygenase domain-containing protein n=1 Tax=Physocladia obscura TaxID=109957 RepID=A0AAD5T0D4_9FUNG|nr:hypothetical protein HK100_012025 [Physocladia obscura]